MALNYTERTTGATVASSELNALADNAAALSTDAHSNDASTERDFLADFVIVLATQASARDASAQVSLLIVPEVNSLFGDVATLRTANNYIARYGDGTKVTLTLDAATTARTLTITGIQVPNANFKIGLLNESGYALAATGNSIFMTGLYTSDNV